MWCREGRVNKLCGHAATAGGGTFLLKSGGRGLPMYIFIGVFSIYNNAGPMQVILQLELRIAKSSPYYAGNSSDLMPAWRDLRREGAKRPPTKRTRRAIGNRENQTSIQNCSKNRDLGADHILSRPNRQQTQLLRCVSGIFRARSPVTRCKRPIVDPAVLAQRLQSHGPPIVDILVSCGYSE